MFFTIFLAWADMWSCRCLHCKVTILDHEAACLFKIQFERTQTGTALPRTSEYVFMMIHDVDRYPQFLVSRHFFQAHSFKHHVNQMSALIQIDIYGAVKKHVEAISSIFNTWLCWHYRNRNDMALPCQSLFPFHPASRTWQKREPTGQIANFNHFIPADLFRLMNLNRHNDAIKLTAAKLCFAI